MSQFRFIRCPELDGYEGFFRHLRSAGFAQWISTLKRETSARLRPDAHGDLARWREAVWSLPLLPARRIRLDAACVGAEPAADASATELSRLRAALEELRPWRKGPYCLQGVRVDAEWRSDWKWDRLAGGIQSLKERAVLDVGCGNGYHCWRMAGSGAAVVMGIDPTLLSVMQFMAVASYLSDERVAVLPLALEDLPKDLTGFDSVFSMGVLSHRRSPLDHLRELRRLLRPGGELILETLVVAGDKDRVLVPEGRYARMRNVWFLPSARALQAWLVRCGFQGVRLLNVTPTSVEEQRPTTWMRFQSLADALDPQDPGKTVEGHPAPRRAILTASA